MNTHIELQDVELHFEELVEAVEAGQEVIIESSGKPILKLVMADETQKPIVPGFAAKELAGFQSVSWSEIDANFNNLFQD